MASAPGKEAPENRASCLGHSLSNKRVASFCALWYDTEASFREGLSGRLFCKQIEKRRDERKYPCTVRSESLGHRLQARARGRRGEVPFGAAGLKPVAVGRPRRRGPVTGRHNEGSFLPNLGGTAWLYAPPHVGAGLFCSHPRAALHRPCWTRLWYAMPGQAAKNLHRAAGAALRHAAGKEEWT